MTRRFVGILFSVALILTLGQGMVEACAKCDVERTCTKTDTGMTCIVKAKGETTADAVRKCMRNHVENAPKQEGVTVTFTDIEGGIQVAMSATTPEGIKALQAHSTEGCAKHAKGCDADCTKDCPHAKKAGCAKVAESKDCAKAKADAKTADCTKDCAKDCPHAKKAGCAKAAESKDCAKAKADAKTADCAKDCAKDCPHAKKAGCAKAAESKDCAKAKADAKTADCAKDCAKDCPHAKAAATEKREGCSKPKAAHAAAATEKS